MDWSIGGLHLVSCCEAVEGRQKAATPRVHGFISKHRWPSGGTGRRLRCMWVEVLCVSTHLISAECTLTSAHLPLVMDEIACSSHIGTNLQFQNKCDCETDCTA